MTAYLKLAITNLSYDDIRDTLNANGGSVDNNFESAFQEAANINPWSKYKPFNCNRAYIGTMNEQLQLLKQEKIAYIEVEENRQAAVYYRYGVAVLQVQSVYNPSLLYGLVQKHGGRGYLYDRPTGGASSPYRIGDFRRYYPMAYNPVGCTYYNGEEVPINGAESNYDFLKTLMGMEQGAAPDDSNLYLVKDDLYKERVIPGQESVGLHRGAMVTDGKTSVWCSEYIPWGSSDSRFNFQQFMGKEVTVFEFLTNVNYNLDQRDDFPGSGGQVFMALPDPIRTIKVTNGYPEGMKRIVVEGNANGIFMEDKIQYTFTLTLEGGVSSVTLRNLYVTTNKMPDGNPNGQIDIRKISDSVTLMNGEPQTYIGTFPKNYVVGLPFYFCIYFDNKLQKQLMILYQAPDPDEPWGPDPIEPVG